MDRDNSEPITRQLNRTDTSGPSRWKRLAPLVDRELQKLAAASLRQFMVVNWRPTLQPEELVSEFYLRLLRDNPRHWENRRHFFAHASTTMRNILIDRHRAKKAGKRLPDGKSQALDGLFASEEPASNPLPAMEIRLALGRLEEFSPRQAKIIDLRFFAGLDIAEIAKQLDVSEKTVQRDWMAGRAFLYAELSGLPHSEQSHQQDP
jgi:RNA polymerase sigma factor (TIGR02999 family)